MEPLISVIVPVYNAADTISRTLKSLTNNNHALEIICVNDGSTDKSSNIINEYAKSDSRVRLINQSNKGAAAARNTGLQNAQGGYTMFCDADDEYDDNVFDCVIEDIRKYGSDCIIFGRTTSFSDGRKKNWLPNREECVRLAGDWVEYFNKTLFERHHSYVVYNRAYKTSILKENNITFDVDVKLGEDLLFNIRAMRHINSLIEDGRAVYMQHKRDESLTTSYRPNFIHDSMSVTEHIRNELGDKASLIQPFLDWRILNTTEFAVNRALIGRDAHTIVEKKMIIKKALANPEFYIVWDRAKYNIDPYMRKKISLLVKHRVILYAIRYIYLSRLKENWKYK